MLCCGYTLTDFPISIKLTSLALWQSNDCPSASKATLMNMDKYFMWIHYERLHNHNKAKHNKTVCILLGIYCIASPRCQGISLALRNLFDHSTIKLGTLTGLHHHDMCQAIGNHYADWWSLLNVYMSDSICISNCLALELVLRDVTLHQAIIWPDNDMFCHWALYKLQWGLNENENLSVFQETAFQNAARKMSVNV